MMSILGRLPHAAFLGLILLLGGALSVEAQDVQKMPFDDVAFQGYLDSWLAANGSGLTTLASDPSADFGPISSALAELSGRLSSFDAITAFRRWPSDDDLVDLLLPFAPAENIELRRRSTTVLASVVDNTNVCRVIAKLSKEADTLSVTGRYNLLLVVAAVSTYARSDTAVWMTTLVRNFRNSGDKINGQPKTSFVLASIEVAAYGAQTTPSNSALAAENGRKYDKCLKLLPADITQPAALPE